MKRLAIAALFAVSGLVQADITYRVDVQPDKNNLHVTMHLPNTDHGCKLQIPNWGPGGYVIRDGSKSVHNLKATDGKGQELNIQTLTVGAKKEYQDGDQHKVAENPITTWIVAPAKDTTVEYDIDSRLTDGAMHWGGPGTYLYEVSRRKEKCYLDPRLPDGWSAYCGLDSVPVNAIPNDRGPISNGTSPARFTRTMDVGYWAKDYDTFADNPVTIGGADGLIVDTYVTDGKTHYIVMRGAAKSKVDRAKLLKACKFVSDAENDFFGNRPPYNKYVWHFAVNDAADGAGGLEHLSSTEITLAAGVGPRAVSVLAHEFFHLWNVKRIRSFPLGPFDYTKLPQTGAIWWLEGVTDYYAYTLLHRYGWTTDDDYFKDAASNLQIVMRNPAHEQVGPFEASMRVDESNNGHGNSNGYLISYYNLGWLGGMCLDIELRAKSGGKHTLDDVEHALWDMCKDGKPGFQEGEIRNQLIRFGGPEMGPVYDRFIMQPNMPIDEALALAGMKAVATTETYPDLGFGWGGRGFGPGTGLPANNIHGPAAGVLQDGDLLLGVNGTMLEGTNSRELGVSMAAAMRTAAVGTPIKLTIKRGDGTMEVTVTLAAATRSIYTVERNPDATADQKKIADAWLAQKSIK